jgi:hypothetical protein
MSGGRKAIQQGGRRVRQQRSIPPVLEYADPHVLWRSPIAVEVRP